MGCIPAAGFACRDLPYGLGKVAVAVEAEKAEGSERIGPRTGVLLREVGKAGKDCTMLRSAEPADLGIVAGKLPAPHPIYRKDSSSLYQPVLLAEGPKVCSGR